MANQFNQKDIRDHFFLVYQVVLLQDYYYYYYIGVLHLKPYIVIMTLKLILSKPRQSVSNISI